MANLEDTPGELVRIVGTAPFIELEEGSYFDARSITMIARLDDNTTGLSMNGGAVTIVQANAEDVLKKVVAGRSR